MDAKLISISPKGVRKVFPLVAAVTTLGRQADCNLQIPLSEISRQHCQLKVEGGKIIVKDLGSANGTVVNGQKISQQELKPGDLIALTDTVKFLIQIDGKPANIDESKFRQTSVAEPRPAAQKAQPAEPTRSVATKIAPEEDADNILGESFFKDMDEDEE